MGRESWSLRGSGRFTARPIIRLAYSLIIGFFTAEIVRHEAPARTRTLRGANGPSCPSRRRGSRRSCRNRPSRPRISPVGRTTTATNRAERKTRNPIIRRTLASRARRPPINWGVHAWVRLRADHIPAVTRCPFPRRRVSRGERADPSILGRPVAKRVIAKARRLRVLTAPSGLCTFAIARSRCPYSRRQGRMPGSRSDRMPFHQAARGEPPFSWCSPTRIGRLVTRPLTRSSWNDRHPST